MPYTLVSSATLGFDLVRLPAGRQVADVLLAGLGADGPVLTRLAAHHPSTTRSAAGRQAGAVRGRKARELAAGAVPQLQSADFSAATGVGAREDALVALLERSTLGSAATLERLLRDDVLGPEHAAAPGLDEQVRERAADVLADAAVAFWAVEALPPVVFRELVAPFRSATADGLPVPAHDLGPAADRLLGVLATLRSQDAVGRGRWRIAVDEVRDQHRPWAAAMHEASWAAHVSGRTRSLAVAQLLAVQAFLDGGFTAGDGAQGAWNAVAGCVQGIAMSDLLDEQSLAVLLQPWSLLY